MSGARRWDYWLGTIAPDGPKANRWRALAVPFYGALCAAAGAGSDRDADPLSLATCEKVYRRSPVCDFSEGGLSAPSADRRPLTDPEREGLSLALRLGVEDVDRAARLVRSPDAREALLYLLEREADRRRELVLGLIERGEVAHARRLAMCRKTSVQLGCPEMGGGCGSTENYVPIGCDSRLCPDCMKRKMGRVAAQYRGVVRSWDHPTMIRLSLPDRVDGEDLARGVDALRGAFGRLRRRVVPPEGEHQARRWVWWHDGGEPASNRWKVSLQRAGRHDLARRWSRRYVDADRGIPFKEIVPAGFYGIDIKEKADGRFNVHMHVLADVPWIPQGALSKLWDDVIGAPVVDIRRIDHGPESAEGALMEVIGYAAKPPEFSTVDAELSYQGVLRGSKLIQPFGELHGNTPTIDGLLRCERCEVSPAWWDYLGIVNDTIETVTVVGSSSDGDRPPPP